MCEMCDVSGCDCGSAESESQFVTNDPAQVPAGTYYTTLPTASDALGLASNQYWSGSTVTYTFPGSGAAFYTDPYYSLYNEPQSFRAFSEFGKSVLREAFGVWDALMPLSLQEVSGSSSADIQLGGSTVPSTAWAYYPGSETASGDVWFNTSASFLNNLVKPAAPIIGSYAYATSIHEIGHALGLKHPHQASGGNSTTIPLEYDALEYTVMSYRSYLGGNTGAYTVEKWGYPQSPMMLDISMMQQIYGADYTTLSGDTTYTVDPNTGEFFVDGTSLGVPGANRVFRTLWDGNGTDHIDLSNYATDLLIDLTPGSGIDLDRSGNTQAAKLGSPGGTPIYAHSNIYMSLLNNGDTRSLIENATGGFGDDILIGNAAANRLDGGLGADVFTGGLGADVLVMGTGADTVTDTLAGLDGDTLIGFDSDDSLIVQNTQLTLAGLSYDGTTGLLTIDADGDGTAEAVLNIGTSGNGIAVTQNGADSVITLTGAPPPVEPPVDLELGAQLLAAAVLSLEEGDDYSNLGGTSEINTGSYTEKTTSLSFTTSNDVTSLQVLYEQGGGVKGFNIFIENGVLKASIWNGSDYDLVETPITALSHHSVSFVFSGGQGSASTIQLWLDGVLRDSAASFDTLERHTQSGAAGEVYQTTIINGVETADTLQGSDPLAFTGFIHAVTQHNEALNAAEIAALAAVMPAGDGSLPSTPPPTTSSLGDQLLALAVLSLEEGDNYSNLGGTDEINTGSYTEKTTSLSFTTSNDVTSLQVLYEQGGGVKGFNIFIENGFLKASIWNGSDYDLVETPITALADHSVAFVFSGGQGSASSIDLWLDGVLCDTAASFDTLTRHTQSGAAGEVYQTTIINGVETADTLQGGDPLAFTGTIHAVTQHNEALDATEIEALAAVLPAGDGSQSSTSGNQLLEAAHLYLEEGDDYSNLGGTPEINMGSYTEKTTSLTFTTSSDVTSLQVLYEQGGGVKGLNIFIENGFLKASIWNGSDYDLVETPITALADHSVSFVFSGGQGSASSIGLWLDGVLCDTAASFDTLERHTQSGAAGEVYQTTIINGVETADTLQGGDPLAFTGTIHAVTQHNQALGAAEIEALAVVLPADSAASAAPAASQLAVFDTEVDEIEFLAAAQTGTGVDADLETGRDTGLESDLDLAAELAHLTQTADPYDLWA